MILIMIQLHINLSDLMDTIENMDSWKQELSN